MSRLDLRHLDMLAAIEVSRTLADAAERLHISPSAVTHRLRDAERRLGVRLFQRQGRHLRPTVAGQILAQAALRIQADLEQTERAAIATTADITEIVRVSVAVYNAFHWLPGFMTYFRSVEPRIQIQVETLGSDTPYDNLARHKVDVLLTPDTVIPASVDTVDLFADELVAVVPPNHAHAGREFLTGADFVSEIYLTYSLVKQPGFEADRVWATEGVMPLLEENIGSIEAACELIKAGFGISILSRWALKPQFEVGALVPVRVTSAGLDMTWRALVRSEAAPDAPERRMAAALAEWFTRPNPACGVVESQTRP